MQKPGSPGAGKDEQPVVRPALVRPFELPRLSVAEKVDLPPAFGVCVLNRVLRQHAARATGQRLGAVAGLDEEERAVEARRVRRGDAAAANRQKHQAQPAACCRALGEEPVELLYRRARGDGRVGVGLPARRLETYRIFAGLPVTIAIHDLQTRLTDV